MSQTALHIYLTGLRNQHAVETQAIGTLQNEISYTSDYPELLARMKLDKEQSIAQAARLDELLGTHGSAKSIAKEAVAGAVATVLGFAHIGSTDDVLKNTMAAIGFKAYEIASYHALVSLAQAAGASGDIQTLEQSLKEEQEVYDWLGKYLPSLVVAFLARQAT